MKNLIFILLLISSSSYSQKRLELAGTFAPDKQLGEINFYKWKKNGFGYYLGVQGGNFGNRLYDSINRDFLGNLLYVDDHISYRIQHTGVLIGAGFNYNQKINTKFSYRLQIGFMFGFENSKSFGEVSNIYSPLQNRFYSNSTSRLSAAVQYSTTMCYLLTKKIGISTSILIPFYFPVTNVYTSGRKNDDPINLGPEPAISVGLFYQWR